MMAALLCASKDVWVAALHLVADPVENVAEREMTRVFGHLSVEHDLELEVAELVREPVYVLAGDRVGDLVGFLDGVGRDRLERLDAVPFAAADGIAQPAHDLGEAIEAHEGAFPL